MIQEVWQWICLTVLFWIVKFLLILHQSINYLQKPCKNLKLVYQLIVIYAKKLVLLAPILFDDNRRVTFTAFFVADFNLLNRKFDDFKFSLCRLISNKFAARVYNTFTFLYEKYRIVSLTSSKIKSKILFPALSRFPIRLVCCIAFGSASSASCLLKSIANQVVVFFKVWIIKQVTICVTIF